MEMLTTPRLVEQAQIWVADYGLRALSAVALYLVGRWCAHVLKRLVVRALTGARMDPNLISFAGNLSYYGVVVFTLLAILGQLGIATTSLIAVMGAAGLAIGLALQGSLTNFAAGLLIVFFRPFRVGDTIEGAGVHGVVEDIQILTTAVRLPDNRLVTIPNNSLTGANITNCSAMDTTSVDITVTIPHGEDLAQAKATLADILAGDPRVLAAPTPAVAVSGLSETTVTIVAKAWARPQDAGAVRSRALEAAAYRIYGAGGAPTTAPVGAPPAPQTETETAPQTREVGAALVRA